MEKSTQRPITVARLRSKPTRDGRARRIGGTGVIVRGPGVRRTQGQSTRSSKTAAPGLPREVNLSMATLCSAGVPSTSNASSMSRHTVSAIPLTKSLAFVPSRLFSGNSFAMSLTLELRLSIRRFHVGSHVAIRYTYFTRCFPVNCTLVMKDRKN